MAIEVISKIKPKNNGNFPIIDAADVAVDNQGTRLTDKILELENGGGGGGSMIGETILANKVIVNSTTDKRLSSTVAEVDNINTALESGTAGTTTMREVQAYKYVKKSVYNVNSKTEYGNNASYAHGFYAATPGVTYYVTGSTPSNSSGHPLCTFFDADGNLREKFGTEESHKYEDEVIVAPANSAYMVVNKTTSQLVSIVVKRAIPSTGYGVIDRINTELFDLQADVTELQVLTNQDNQVTKGTIIEPDETIPGVYNINTGESYMTNEYCYHCIYTVQENSYYYVSGNSTSNPGSYPLCCFLDENCVELAEFGMDPNTSYSDELVKSPMTATTLIVNRSWSGQSIIVKVGISYSNTASSATVNRSYNLNMADMLIRMNKINPFVWKPLDKGYVTFVFDDLCDDVDSVASLFEQYNKPLVLAAIADAMVGKCTFLQETRGNFTPGMTKKDVMTQVVTNGGEIMQHNSSPVVTADSQYDYDFMYGYFCTSKENLNNAGFYPRGIIRAGGTGAINRSTEIDRWLIGNYEYANMGTLPQYNWDRTSIQQSQENLKAAILAAKTNNTWLRFMCHSYDFGNGETFTGEADLIELLDYIDEIGIDVVTVGYMFDTFGSNAFEERLKALES